METVFSRGNSTFGLLNGKHKNSHGMCEQSINKMENKNVKKSFANMFYELFKNMYILVFFICAKCVEIIIKALTLQNKK